MRNKEIFNNEQADRPCFFVFRDSENQDIIWLIPISSKYDKYKKIYDKNMEKYGRCPTIRFGEVLGTQAAFLIQNMSPATEKYIHNIYLDKNDVPVTIDNRVILDVVTNAKNVLARSERGVKLIFPDVYKIKKMLIDSLSTCNVKCNVK